MAFCARRCIRFLQQKPAPFSGRKTGRAPAVQQAIPFVRGGAAATSSAPLGRGTFPSQGKALDRTAAPPFFAGGFPPGDKLSPQATDEGNAFAQRKPSLFRQAEPAPLSGRKTGRTLFTISANWQSCLLLTALFQQERTHTAHCQQDGRRSGQRRIAGGGKLCGGVGPASGCGGGFCGRLHRGFGCGFGSRFRSGFCRGFSGGLRGRLG